MGGRPTKVGRPLFLCAARYHPAAMSKSPPPPEDVTVRRARRDDIDPLAAFLEPFVEARQVLPRTADELFYLIPTGFVAEAGGRVVGFASLEIYSHKLAEIRSLAVAEAVRGRGVASRLINACVDLAREKGVYEVLAVTARDDLFRRCGFDHSLPDQKRALFLQTRAEP